MVNMIRRWRIMRRLWKSRDKILDPIILIVQQH